MKDQIGRIFEFLKRGVWISQKFKLRISSAFIFFSWDDNLINFILLTILTKSKLFVKFLRCAIWIWTKFEAEDVHKLCNAPWRGVSNLLRTFFKAQEFVGFVTREERVWKVEKSRYVIYGRPRKLWQFFLSRIRIFVPEWENLR